MNKILDIIDHINHFPSKDDIAKKNELANASFPKVLDKIKTNLQDDVEYIDIFEDEFDNISVFALVMGKCGEYFTSNDPKKKVAYQRSDGTVKVSIRVINVPIKVARLKKEIEECVQQLNKLTDHTTSKAMKLQVKIEKRQIELNKYGNIF